MSLDTVAKVKVSIGPATRCTTPAEFKALTEWEEIKNVIDVGEMSGDKPIAIGRYLDQDFVRKLTGGPRDKGAITMVFGHDPDDDGQVALKLADADDDSYTVKIELPDAPSGGTPTTWFFMAVVGPLTLGFGDGTQEIRLTSAFNIDGDVFEEAAAASGG